MTGNHNCRIRNFQYLKDLTIQGFFVFLCLCRFLMCIFAGKLNIGWLSTSFLGLFMCFGNILCSTDTDYYCCLVFFPLSSSLYLTACYCFCIDVYFPSFLSENSVIIQRLSILSRAFNVWKEIIVVTSFKEVDDIFISVNKRKLKRWDFPCGDVIFESWCSRNLFGDHITATCLDP